MLQPKRFSELNVEWTSLPIYKAPINTPTHRFVFGNQWETNSLQIYAKVLLQISSSIKRTLQFVYTNQLRNLSVPIKASINTRSDWVHSPIVDSFSFGATLSPSAVLSILWTLPLQPQIDLIVADQFLHEDANNLISTRQSNHNSFPSLPLPRCRLKDGQFVGKWGDGQQHAPNSQKGDSDGIETVSWKVDAWKVAHSHQGEWFTYKTLLLAPATNLTVSLSVLTRPDGSWQNNEEHGEAAATTTESANLW